MASNLLKHFGDIDDEQLAWLRDELAAAPDMNHLLALRRLSR